MGHPIRFRRRIRRSGGSSMVAIPPEVMEALGWKVGDEVYISITREGAILIEKADD